MNNEQARATVRPPAVAGLFYEADPTSLRADLAQLLDARESPRAELPRRPRALIVPHAGYVYSGAAAASAYRLLTPWREAIARVVLAGPPHRKAVAGAASLSSGALRTPLGDVAVDCAVVDELERDGLIVRDDAAHRAEHALEVQLPFLQTVLDDFRLVPLLIGELAAADTAALLSRWWDDDDSLIVVSTDLSHFHTYREAQRIDAATDAIIRELDPRHIGPLQACGCRALNGLLFLARERHANIERQALCNSGDTAGDHDRVVGYAAYALY